MEALVAKALMGYPNTRDDQILKMIFKRMVEKLGKLDDVYAEPFFKTISDLEAIATVIVKFDHECDASALEMFRHFLKNIRPDHPQKVFISMETAMTGVLMKSEIISSELLSYLCIKNDNKEVLPDARRLVDNVMCKCAMKLRPYFKEVVNREYNTIFASICFENTDAGEQIALNIVEGPLVRESNIVEKLLVEDEGDDIRTPLLPVVNRHPAKHTQQDRSGADDTPDAERQTAGGNGIYYVGVMLCYWLVLYMTAPVAVGHTERMRITMFVLQVFCVCCYLIALGIHRFQSPSAPAKYIMLFSSVVFGYAVPLCVPFADLIDIMTVPGG